MLSDENLVDHRIWPGGFMATSTAADNHMKYMRFFSNPKPETKHPLSWTPIWRLAEQIQPLDEIVLGVDSLGHQYVCFNGKERHGTWEFDRTFLDIKVNVRFGEPGCCDGPNVGKWTRFQNIPGTTTWIRCETYDNPCYVIVMSSIMPTGLRSE